MMLKRSNILAVFFILSFQPLLAQENIIKDFADTTSIKDYCFYPSTLRMLNLTENQDYYDMVEDIEKILVYNLDSTSMADKSYMDMLSIYQKGGFEELAIMEGGKTNFYIYVKEGVKNEYIGVFREQESVYAFYLLGKIGLQKIPDLIETVSQGDMFNLFEIKPSNGKKHP